LYWCHVAARETLIMFLRFLWFEPLFRSQCERVGRGFQMEQLPYITGSGQIQIGDNVRLSGKPGLGFCNRFGNLPKLTIGNRTFIGHRCDFSIGSSITIGNDCLIAGGVSIRDYDGHPIDAKERREGKCVSASDVKQVLIGDDVWICSGATILKGVTVGARAIVAANSTVTSDVPPDTIVGGCPAVIIKKLIPTSHE
jgi:acetyltransferase-like isoleucine patch superfamily enzyme